MTARGGAGDRAASQVAVIQPAVLAQGTSPWVDVVANLSTAFTGPIARGLALVSIVIGGLMFAFGEGGSKSALAGIIFGLGMALGAANLITAQDIQRMNADADDVAWLDPRGIKWIKSFIGENRVAPLGRRRRRENVQPPRGNDRGAELDVTGVDQVDLHPQSFDLTGSFVKRRSPRDRRGL